LPLPLPPTGGAAHDALTNKPALRPISAPPVELGLASEEEEAVMIAFGAFGGVSACRRLGVAASPSTLGSSRNPSVNGLAVSAPALAHAEEPAAGGWEAAWKEDTMSDGSVSMSGMPAAARPLESIPRRARRCAFSDSRRVISCSRTSDQSTSHSALAVSECAVDVGSGSGLPDVLPGIVVMVVLEVVAISAAAVAAATAETVALS
jgi:hypothetical protein